MRGAGRKCWLLYGSALFQRRFIVVCMPLFFVLVGCTIGDLGAPAATATVPPLPTVTPAPSSTPTASQVPTASLLPTATQTATFTETPTSEPTATNTPTATATPTGFAIVRSQQRVNVRAGPGTGNAVIGLLAPGSGVQILASEEAADWYRVRLDDGDEGWVSAALLRVVAEVSASRPADEAGEVDLPAITSADGTPIAAEESADELAASDGQIVFNLPIVDIESINLTATVLVAISARSTAEGAAAEIPPTAITAIPTAISVAESRTPAPARQGVDVFAFCSNSAFGIPAPTNLAAGSTIEIYWAWFASSEAYLRLHISNATHELRINGTRITNVNHYRRQPNRRGNDQVVYWYVPFGPLEAGDYRITYRVTWRSAISDGYNSFGPGTGTEFEEESCNFVVR